MIIFITKTSEYNKYNISNYPAVYFSRANLTGAQGKDSMLKGVHVTCWFCGLYVTPAELEFWLSLKSFEVNIALLKEQLHAQDF